MLSTKTLHPMNFKLSLVAARTIICLSSVNVLLIVYPL